MVKGHVPGGSAGGYIPADATESHSVLTSRLYRHDGQTAPVIWCHGHSSIHNVSIAILYDQTFLGDSAHAIARGTWRHPRGWPVFAGDFEENAWGNDASLNYVDTAVSWAVANLGAADTGVFLCAGSMGMLTALNWYYTRKDNPGAVPVLGVAGMIPAVDLDDIHDRNYSGYAAEIEAAYGGLAAYEAALPTHNPTAYAADLVGGPPIKIWYSSNDPATLAASIEAFGATSGAELVNLGAVGHATTGMNMNEIPEFYEACLALS